MSVNFSMVPQSGPIFPPLECLDLARLAVERVGFQNFVEEEGNCLELLLLLRKSFLLLDLTDGVCILGSLGILKALGAKKGYCCCTVVFDKEKAKICS